MRRNIFNKEMIRFNSFYYCLFSFNAFNAICWSLEYLLYVPNYNDKKKFWLEFSFINPLPKAYFALNQDNFLLKFRISSTWKVPGTIWSLGVQSSGSFRALQPKDSRRRHGLSWHQSSAAECWGNRNRICTTSRTKWSRM